ncbi:MAG: cytochrome c [Myxococcota bacterium]
MRAWLVAGVLSLGCSPEPPTQVWTASDHVQPQASETQARPGSGPPASDGPAPTSAEQTARAAAALFRVSCASCHGAGGAGDGPAAEQELASFADAAWQEAQSDEAIAQVIAQGRGAMPGFGQRLPAEAIAALVMHIRTLGEGTSEDSPGTDPGEGRQPPATPTPAPSDDDEG